MTWLMTVLCWSAMKGLLQIYTEISAIQSAEMPILQNEKRVPSGSGGGLRTAYRPHWDSGAALQEGVEAEAIGAEGF
jgi:hypothetical protein